MLFSAAALGGVVGAWPLRPGREIVPIVAPVLALCLLFSLRLGATERWNCEAAGLDVVRIPCPGQTDYMNWLVGNGYVAAMTFDNPGADAAAQAQLESLFPGRDVHLIDASTLWAAGGGVHCVTNDQPALP